MSFNDTTLLHVELPKGAKDIKFQMKGNGADIAKLIAHAMEANTDVCALFITAVLGFANEKGMSMEELKAIKQKHEK